MLLIGVAFLSWVVYDWIKRKAIYKAIDEYPCCLCGEPLDEALYDFLGTLKKHEKAKLDKFQAQYAHCKIRCGNCGGILLCADNGTPMRGYYEDEKL